MSRVQSNYLFQIMAWIFGFIMLNTPLYFILLDMQDCIDPQYPFGFLGGLLMNVICGLTLGLVLGTIDWAVEKSLKRKPSFLKVLLLKSSLYILTFLSMVFMTGFFIRLSTTSNAGQSLEGVMSSESFHVMMAYVTFSILYSFIVCFVGMTRRMFGQGVIGPLFFGQYSTPREEERIFLFLDLKSSTTIAEELGHLRFSHLIQDCFYDLNQLLEEYQATIYQYVGDEAIVYWKRKAGLTRVNCLYLFFAFCRLLQERSDAYQLAYGHVPEFKAGIHIGQATISEVGDLKKEIAFHGDVLNTTARLQSICNDYKVNCMLSEKLRRAIGEDHQGLEFIPLGEVVLKGKKTATSIFTVKKTTP